MPLTRRETIVQMLRYYNQAEETLHENQGGGKGDRLLLMPPDWNRSFRELERCLHNLKLERPAQHWHVVERYLRCEDRLLHNVTVDRRPKGPHARLPAHCELVAIVAMSQRQATVRVRCWNPGVRASKVDGGVDFLLGCFHGEPFLPGEILAAVA